VTFWGALAMAVPIGNLIWLANSRELGDAEGAGLGLARLSWQEACRAQKDPTAWLRREDSNSCILKLDPLLSIMA
jgi:hypothetical protein